MNFINNNKNMNMNSNNYNQNIQNMNSINNNQNIQNMNFMNNNQNMDFNNIAFMDFNNMNFNYLPFINFNDISNLNFNNHIFNLNQISKNMLQMNIPFNMDLPNNNYMNESLQKKFQIIQFVKNQNIFILILKEKEKKLYL